MRALVNHGSDCQLNFSDFDRITHSLCSSEEGFQSIAENSDHAILVSYGIDTFFVYANRFAAQLTGYSSIELLKLRPSQLVDARGHPHGHTSRSMVSSGKSRTEASCDHPDTPKWATPPD